MLCNTNNFLKYDTHKIQKEKLDLVVITFCFKHLCQGTHFLILKFSK